MARDLNVLFCGINPGLWVVPNTSGLIANHHAAAFAEAFGALARAVGHLRASRPRS